MGVNDQAHDAGRWMAGLSDPRLAVSPGTISRHQHVTKNELITILTTFTSAYILTVFTYTLIPSELWLYHNHIKMPTHHISSTSIALFRVFIAPNLRTTTTVPLTFAPAFASHVFSAPPISYPSHCQIRTKTYQKKDTTRHALTDHYVLNNAIPSPVVNLVAEDGTFTPNVRTADAIRSMNYVTHYLMQVSAGKVDEFGEPDPNDIPTARIISKMALREKHQKTLETARKLAKSQGSASVKNLELNWAIAGGDLGHRLEKLKGFLREGKKVEVMFGPKRRGKKATEQQAEGVLKAVRDAVGECKGANEAKSEGVVGGVLTVVFEGRKLEEKKVEVVKEVEAE